jgi:oligoendopeptidase F
MLSMNDTAIPHRKEMATEDTWDLSSLYPDDAVWNNDCEKLERILEQIPPFKGTLSSSAEKLGQCLDLIVKEAGILLERIAYYSMLKKDENLGNSCYSGLNRKYQALLVSYNSAKSFLKPEILAIPEGTLNQYLESGILDDYRIYLAKLIHFRDHTLSEKEERLLALQEEFAGTAQRAFSVLTNVDLSFGFIETPKGKIPLTQGTFSLFLLDPDRKIREKAYKQFYKEFTDHKNTLSELYIGSIQRDKYKAKVRNYSDSRQAALFPDKVPPAVYDTLISEVRKGFSHLHRYYQLRKRILNLDELKHYDVYVSLVPDIKIHHTYKQAVIETCLALSPLGEEYVSLLEKGLSSDRWVDIYENQGKRSGAYSAGSYTGKPYILMNYREEDIRQVFTLAHEAGHSMHSWYSAKNNPYPHYSYTIFEAEVASTFNEQLLGHHLLRQHQDPAVKRYLLGRQLSDIVATLFRQTMFAEYEDKIHRLTEGGTPLTLDLLRSEYRLLLEAYFGPALAFEEESDLEGLRIPHFYRAFYVYKYATGLAAAMALSKKVLSGGDKERGDYLSFLKSGGSLYPLESLKIAGVDLTTPDPVKLAVALFGQLLDEFEALSF